MDFQDAEMFRDNSIIFNFYRTRLMNLAWSQFSYEGMPDTFDRRYFEKKMLINGKAALLHEPITDAWYGLGYVSDSDLDLYEYPKRIRGIGYNTSNIIPDKFVCFYDNEQKMSMMVYIDMYAKLLTECHMTFRINLDKQNTPFLITCGRNRQFSYKNLFARWAGYQRYFFLRRKDDKEDISTLNTEVPYIGQELLLSLRTLWTQALMFLAIAPSDTVEKKERLNVEEVAFNREESEVMKTERAIGRLEGLEKFNKMTGYNAKLHLNHLSTDLPMDMYSRELSTITGDYKQTTGKE